MAVIKPTSVPASKNMEVIVKTWTPLTTGDTGEPVQLSEYGDKTFQAFGTFGGASIAIEGSNDGTNWSPISNRQGTAMAFTAIGMNTSQDRPAYVRPNCTGGAGVSVSISVACHRSDLSAAG